MADKRRVKKSIRQLQKVKTWQLVILLVLAMFIAATLLRMNNTGMIARRQAVVSADKQGELNNLTNRLVDLQRYSAAHMNASTGPVYLPEQYNRDIRKQAANSDGSAKSMAIRQEAEDVCKPQFTSWSPAYVQCYVNELNKHPAGEIESANLQPPNPALYRYEFSSPVWSPDFAGWSIVLCGVITLVIIGRLLSLALLKLMLKRHYQDF